MGNLQVKGKEVLKEMLYLFTLALLTLILPLSFLLLAKFTDAQYYLQTLTRYHSPYLLTLALHINPLILYVLVSIVSMVSLIHGFTGKIIILSDPLSSLSRSTVFQTRLYTAWILLCTFQVCVGLGIEGSIEAGVSYGLSFGSVERSLLSRVVFLLGLNETTQVWAKMVVRPVVDDTVFGVDREERWVERVVVAASLGLLWWWRLGRDVESLVIMFEAKKEQFMEMRINDYVGWSLYYLTVTIGMVRLVKALMWIVTICRPGRVSTSTLQHFHNDYKV